MTFRSIPKRVARERMVAEFFGDDDLALLRTLLVEYGATAGAARDRSTTIAWHAMVFATPSATRAVSKANRATLHELSKGLEAIRDARKSLDPELSVKISQTLANDPAAKAAWIRLGRDAEALSKPLKKFEDQYRGAKPSDDAASRFLVTTANEWRAATGLWPVEARAETPSSRPPKAPLYEMVRKLVSKAATEYGLTTATASLTPNRFVEAIKAAKKSAAK